MIRRLCPPGALAVLAFAMTGCGGGHTPSDTLLSFQVGRKWVYQVSGTVTPASGGSQSIQATQSTLTFEVASTTVKDANGTALTALDRKYNIVLLDGTTVKGVQRLYFTQNASGFFVHGINSTAGDIVPAPANDKMVPATANPPFQFLYLPSPLADNLAVSYTDPFVIGGTTDNSYSFATGAGRSKVSVPAGSFLARPMSAVENFDSFSLTQTGIVADVGIVIGQLDATLANGTRIQGVISLQ